MDRVGDANPPTVCSNDSSRTQHFEMNNSLAVDERPGQAESPLVELRRVEVFADLPEDQLSWLAERVSFRDLEPGDVIIGEGDPLEIMVAVLRGELRTRREHKENTAADSWLYVWKAGELTGKLPYSRITRASTTTRAAVPSRIAEFSTDIIPEMLARIPVLIERCVRLLLDRARMHVRDEEQNQSLLALGRIAAGLAHELYNPTAAVLRGAGALRQRVIDFRHSSMNLAQPEVRNGVLRTLAVLNQRKQAAAAQGLDPIARSERLEQLGEWLDDRKVQNAWSLAESFLDAGLDIADLEQLTASFPDHTLVDVLVWLDSVLAAENLLQDMERATTRVAELVDALKSYSYLDRSPERAETDLHSALDDTLKILGHKLHDKRITVVRDYHPNLPLALVHAGEMNQVWTNLLDNAIDAVDDRGRIHVRTGCEPSFILVEIADNGPGIPKETQSRIWEPFFTTKDVGKGMGLGLDIVQRIVVRRHQGEIRVQSVPGETRFQVRLPRSST
jgi:signal transduction histidine kinase